MINAIPESPLANIWFLDNETNTEIPLYLHKLNSMDLFYVRFIYNVISML